jgi:FMN phosphatase YigB (HAD superfamily)
MAFEKSAAVFFDLDNTLFDYEAAFQQASLFAFQHVFPSLIENSITPEYWFRSYKSYCDLFWKEYEAKEISREHYQRKRLVSSLLSCQIHTFSEGQLFQFHKLFQERIPFYVKPFEWTKMMVDMIRLNGSECGIITNGFSELQRKKINKLDLGFSEESIYISSEMKYTKPDPAIFTFVARNCRSREFLYVGDSFDFDMIPAVRAGWTGLWWNPERRPFPQEDERIISCHSAESLIELIKKYIE